MQEGQSHFDLLHSLSYKNLHGVVAEHVKPYEPPEARTMNQWVEKVFRVLQKHARTGEYGARFIVFNASSPSSSTDAQDICPPNYVLWCQETQDSIRGLQENQRAVARKRLYELALEATKHFEVYWNTHSDVGCHAANMSTHICLVFDWQEPQKKRAKK